MASFDRAPARRAPARLGLLSVLVLLLAARAMAGPISLAWDASPDAVTGYTVHYGTASGSYANHVDVGNTTGYTIANVQDDVTYFVAVTAYGASGAQSGYSNEISATSYAAPVAAFEASPVTGTAPLSVNFRSTSTGAITAYSWSFGDGTASSAQDPTHSYAAAGTYSVALTVTGPGGTNTATRTSLIAVTGATTPTPTAPTAAFTADTTSGVAPLSVRFTDASTGTIASWSWSFGDGATSAAKDPVHSYAAAGTYTVALTVSGSAGTSTRTQAGLITVTSSGTTVASGALSGSVVKSSTAVNLTAAGSADWAHWPGYDRKAGGGGQVSNYAQVGTGSVATYSNDPRTLSWTDGTPTVTGSNRAGVYVWGTGNGFQLSAPADTATRTLVVYVGGWNSGGRLTAQLSDGSAPQYVDASVSGSTGSYDAAYTLTYKAGAAGQKLSVRWVQSSGTGNVTLQGAALAGAAATSPSPTPTGRAGLVAAYAFDQGTGYEAVDASGNGNRGTVSNASWVTGRYGKALSFNGSNSLVTVADSPSLDLTGALTLEAWVYPQAGGNAWRTILMKEQPSNLVYYLSSATDRGTPAGGLYAGGGERIVYAPAALATGTWSHVALTYDGATQRLYVNGALVASRAQTGPVAVSAGALRIGGNAIWGEYFQGLIDEVRIYNRALGAAEIQSDMTTAVGTTG